MHRATVRILSGGERVPVLLDVRGVPLFYPTLFATARLRNSGAAVNTIINKLADIRVLLRWENRNNRDLIVEFTQGEFLSLPDIASLRDFAKLDMREVNESEAKECSSLKVIPLESTLASSPAKKSIGRRQHYNRVSTFADYLEFLAYVVTQHRNSTPVAQQIAKMSDLIRKHRPRGQRDRGSNDVEGCSLSTAIVERFMAVGAEDHPQNPFRRAEDRLRNSIIFELLRHTGMRRGELLSLRLDQFELGHEPIVKILRNQDDIHDSRRNQPASKTKERMLPLPFELANKIQRYMLEVRAKIAPARRHPYLLVSHRKDRTFGNPLSLSALSSQIFPRMHGVDGDFKKMHPHALRHNFNYELSVSIDQHNAKARLPGNEDGLIEITETRELDIRAQLNGHRSKASGQVYNRRHIKEVSDQAARHIQGALAGLGRTSEGKE